MKRWPWIAGIVAALVWLGVGLIVATAASLAICWQIRKGQDRR